MRHKLGDLTARENNPLALNGLTNKCAGSDLCAIGRASRGRVSKDADGRERRRNVRQVEGTYGTSYTGAIGRRHDWDAR